MIANAGISWGVDTSLREDLEVMQQVLASNAMGLAASFQPFIDPMVKRGSGRLVVFAVWPVFADYRAMPHIRRVRRLLLPIAKVCAWNCRKPASR